MTSYQPFDLKAEILAFNPHRPLETNLAPPATWYNHPEFFQLERDSVFKGSWLVAGLRSHVGKPGDFFTGTYFKWPFLVVRDEAGELGAYYNICIHRGTCIVEGQGSTDRFTCPYHGWTYGLSGRLTKAPGAGSFRGIKKNQLNLRRIHVDTWGPFVCLYFGENPPSVDDSFQEIDRAALDPFSEMLHVKRVVYDLNCNWKVFVDNYLDNGYHVPHLHPGLSDHLELSTYKAKIGRNVSVQNCRSRPPEEGKQAEESRVGSQVNYFWVYPNFMMNRYGKWMDTNLVIPLSENRCQTIFDYFCEERPGEEDLMANLQASDQVQQEDIEISQRVQRGLESGAYRRGPYAPRFEKPLFHFHCRLARDFRTHLGLPQTA